MRTDPEIQLNSGEIYSEETTEQEWERSLKTLYTQKNQLQHNLSTSAQRNIRRGGWSDPQLTSLRGGPVKERPNNNQNPKTYREPKLMTAQDQRAQEIKEMAPLNPTGILPQKLIPYTQGIRTDQFKKQRLTRRVSQTGKTKKQSPNERNIGSLRKSANWKRGKSTIRYWVQSNGYQEAHWALWAQRELQGNYNEFTANYINMKRK